MNKTQFIDDLADALGCSRAEASRAVEEFIALIAKALKKGDSVNITGFGTFEVRDRKARMGRNPKTGEEIRIKASRVPAFRPGKGLKDKVN